MAKKRIRLDTRSERDIKFDPLHWAKGNPLERTAKVYFTNEYNCTYSVFLEAYGRDWVLSKTVNALKFFHQFIIEEKDIINELASVVSKKLGVDKKAARIVIKKVLHKIDEQLDKQAKEK